MWLFEQYGIDLGYVVLGMAGVILIEFIMLIVCMAKNGKTRKKFRQFMGGKNVKNMEDTILEKFEAVDEVHDIVTSLQADIQKMGVQLNGAYQKIGLVKYDAFKEVGGKLSFVLVLLTAENNGFIMNSMHSTREGCYTYTKEVVGGEAFVILSDEEQQALDEAKANRSLIFKKEDES